MPRLVTTGRQEPYKIDGNGGESIYICGCGLSGNKPFCNGAHKQTLDEDPNALYVYGQQGRIEVPPA